jgi:DNA-binding GntR family transcriptional regulator
MRRIKTVRDLKSEVHKIIKEGITNREFLPGTQLKESDLVGKLGVSRTPIREALNQLSKEGIIEIFPRKGAFVRNCSKEEVIEILILREVLEGAAARLATSHMDEKRIRKLETLFKQHRKKAIDYAQVDEHFHNEIIMTSGSTRLVGLVNNLKDSLQMLDMRAVSFHYPERIKQSLAEHLKIVEAFKAKDAVLAEKLTREHFQNTRVYYEKHLESQKT